MPTLPVLNNQYSRIPYQSSLAILVIIFIFFSNFITALLGLGFMNYLDEIFLLTFIFPFVFLRRVNHFGKFLMLVLFYLIGISYFKESSTLFKVVIQSFIHLKVFIFIFLLDRYTKLKTIEKIIKYLFFISLIGLLLNFALQTSFNNYFNLDSSVRSGLLRLNGFQLSSNNLGLTIVFFFSYFIYNFGKNVPKVIIGFLVSVLILIIIGSRTSIIGVITVFIFWLRSRTFRIKCILYLFIILMLPLFVFLISDSDLIGRSVNNIQMTAEADNSGYIRGIMIVNSFVLFNNYFPFGSGAATFGSVLSDGSQVYHQLGLSSTSFFVEMRGIYDTNWASILGEFGFIGALLFSFLIWKTYNFIRGEYTGSNKPAILSIIVILIISGITMPVFMNGYLAMLFAIFLIYFKKKEFYLS